MARGRPVTTQDILRMEAIAKHLQVRSRFPDQSFTGDVKAAVLDRVAPVVRKLLPCNGEDLAQGLAAHLRVKFEVVHGPNDVASLEDRYLRGKKELGFARLRQELSVPGVDALLFQRMQAREHDSDKWVAVLNLQDSEAREYWNKHHELSHRLAEPPQGILPFKRHQFEAANPVESLVDSVAADLAFYPPVFGPLVAQLAQRSRLDFHIVQAIRSQFAPTASLLCTMKAVVHYWPHPAAALTAEFRGRRKAPETDKALRISVQSSNGSASPAGLFFFSNMRVPPGTPIDLAFQSGVEFTDGEHLGAWDTSQGGRLAAIDVITSARRMGTRVYALMSA